MSTFLEDAEPHILITRFLEATSHLSLRKAGGAGSVSHTKVSEWKEWQEAGADPEAVSGTQPETLEGLRDYLRWREDWQHRRAALRVAADRLEGVAASLREEAKAQRPPTSGQRADQEDRGQKLAAGETGERAAGEAQKGTPEEAREG